MRLTLVRQKKNENETYYMPSSSSVPVKDCSMRCLIVVGYFSTEGTFIRRQKIDKRLCNFEFNDFRNYQNEKIVNHGFQRL